MFLSVTDEQLSKMIADAEFAHDFIFKEKQEAWVRLDTDVLAIIAITSTSDDDPLSFVQEGAGYDHLDEAGGVGRDIDMGCGPASYYKNSFLKLVAKRLEPWTVEEFDSHADMEKLEQEDVYPAGWTDAHRKPTLIEAFALYRDCILKTAAAGQHLLVWCL